MEQPRQGAPPGSTWAGLPPEALGTGRPEAADPAGGPNADDVHGDAASWFARALAESFARPLPAIPGVELVSASGPGPSGPAAGVCDAFELPDGRLLLLAGAVQAGGVRAAALAESVRTATRAVAMVAPSPRYILGAVNQLLLQERQTQRVTAALLLLDPRSGEALVASAGHPAPVRINAGVPRTLAAPQGPALGESAEPYSMRRFGLAAGDSLVLYTTGLPQSQTGRPSPDERPLLERLSRQGPATARDIADQLLGSTPALAGGPAPGIDVVVVRLTSVERVSERELTLAAPLASWRLAEIRQSVRDFLSGHQLSAPLIEDLVLCVEEACANVIRHSGSATAGRLTIAVDEQAVEVVLKDEGRGFGMVLPDPRRPPDPFAGGGRGLYLMACLSDEVEFWNEGGACLRLRRSFRGPGRAHGAAGD